LKNAFLPFKASSREQIGMLGIVHCWPGHQQSNITGY
jgi:hypothetical protein